MKNSKTLFEDFVNSIALEESRDEIKSIAYLAFENIFNLNKAQILAAREITDQSLVDKLPNIIERLNRHEPIQYILGEAFFYDRSFIVNPSVLIPRPETEELVRIILNWAKQREGECTLLDVGTGSGCIAITVALELANAIVHATDVSEDALQIARANARKLGANVNFQKHNILDGADQFSSDIIVSNPPYIAFNERDALPRNVVQYEPSIALFVESENPLKYYKALITYAKRSLQRNGLLAVEINERFGRDVSELLVHHSFQQVEVLKDIYGKDRFVKGILSS